MLTKQPQGCVPHGAQLLSPTYNDRPQSIAFRCLVRLANVVCCGVVSCRLVVLSGVATELQAGHFGRPTSVNLNLAGVWEPPPGKRALTR